MWCRQNGCDDHPPPPPNKIRWFHIYGWICHFIWFLLNTFFPNCQTFSHLILFIFLSSSISSFFSIIPRFFLVTILSSGWTSRKFLRLSRETVNEGLTYCSPRPPCKGDAAFNFLKSKSVCTKYGQYFGRTKSECYLNIFSTCTIRPICLYCDFFLISVCVEVWVYLNGGGGGGLTVRWFD